MNADEALARALDRAWPEADTLIEALAAEGYEVRRKGFHCPRCGWSPPSIEQAAEAADTAACVVCGANWKHRDDYRMQNADGGWLPSHTYQAAEVPASGDTGQALRDAPAVATASAAAVLLRDDAEGRERLAAAIRTVRAQPKRTNAIYPEGSDEQADAIIAALRRTP